MPIAEVFQSGDSQAILLPKEFHLETKQVELVQQGNDILTRQRSVRSYESALEALASMPDDFFAQGRHDPPPEEREEF
jgi:antitoxin VapB